MQNKGGLIILFIVLSVVLFAMFTVDNWSSEISKSGYGTTGTGSTGAELYTGAVSELKGRNSYGNYSVSEEIEVPGAVMLTQMDIENVTQKQSTKSTFGNRKADIQGKTTNFGGSSNDWLAQQSTPTADFDATLKARTTEVKTNTSTSTKSKTDTKTADSKKKNAKTGGLPSEDFTGSGSLPIGDGMWLLLMMLSGYGINKRITQFYM
jgi:hypothetical protein